MSTTEMRNDFSQSSTDIYIGMARSLSGKPSVLNIGALSTLFGGLVTLYYAPHGQLLIIVSLLATIPFWRLYVARKYTPSKIVTLKQAEAAVLCYNLSACAYIFSMGLWTFSVFSLTDHIFPRAIALMSTVSHCLAIASRNYAFPNAARMLLASASAPLAFYCLFVSDEYALVLFMLLPICAFIDAAMKRLKNAFLKEIISKKEIATLAQQFDAALNNMPHGLCMVDRSGRIVVANQALLEMVKPVVREIRSGEDGMQLVRKLIAAGKLTEAAKDALKTAAASQSPTPSVFPIEAADGRVMEMSVTPAHRDNLVIVVQDVTEKCNYERRIDHIARTDLVTGLPNRFHFELAMDALLAADALPDCVLMFVDLDEFKEINDTFGHAAGDKLLAKIARRLEALKAPEDIVARWGGDEFIIFRSSIRAFEEIENFAQMVVEAVCQPCSFGDYQAIISASVGLALAPQDATTPDALLRCADMALYSAKAAGRNRWLRFEAGMNEAVHARRILEADLRAAVANETIEMWFQPFLCVRSGAIRGFEALARWRHERRGYIAPMDFIPIVEELGLIREFTATALRQACTACATWPEPLIVAVNLSPFHFRLGGIVPMVRAILDETKLDPWRLELEITESVILTKSEATLRTLEELRVLGVKIALDDFGSGFSALGYLRSFPLDKVKFDRSFAVNLESDMLSRVLVGGVSQTIKNLGPIVALEGVENERQLEIVRSLVSVDIAQGYLFSRPLPLEQILPMIVDYERRRVA